MATRSTPSTPGTALAQAIPSTSPTGNWRHPKFDEINKRLDATTFGEKSVRKILWRLSSLAVLFLIYQVNDLVSWQLHVDFLRYFQSQLHSVLRLAFFPGLPLTLLAYALLPLQPLIMKPDDLSDIALTPQQRALFGLKAISQPATPGSTYITPPRYSRSATPRSGSTSRSDSPFSAKESPLGSSALPTSYSPTASPLFQKTMGRDVTRKLSFGGSPSPLSLSRNANESSSSLASNATPSPLTGKGASVGLNSRWLYERSRRSSSGLRSVYA